MGYGVDFKAEFFAQRAVMEEYRQVLLLLLRMIRNTTGTGVVDFVCIEAKRLIDTTTATRRNSIRTASSIIRIAPLRQGKVASAL